ncbi:MAG: Ig-like domain-containing protein [Thainema sp.]
MTTYYVSVTGIDAPDRDGLSWETAWNSLAYASDRVSAGNHTIQLGSGTFIATETARPQSGITIAGMRRDGETRTEILATSDWSLSSDPRDGTVALNEYLITLQNVQDITIRDLTLASHPEQRITGGVYGAAVDNVAVERTAIKDFRWAGLQFELSENLNIRNNYIENASTEKFGYTNGLISTRYIKNSEISHNTIISTVERGYGYKGAGHENVRIVNNIFNLERGFAIESAHDNEFGVEIAYNFANQTISIPKGGQGADPANRGYEYSFWIHHNLLTDSYTFEGPRNHLRISHNYVRTDSTGGNFYTHHGGINNGPIWIHKNVIENVDRGLIWMNQGLAENIYVYHNTVTLADAGDRAGAILTAPNREGLGESLNNWVAHNNIFIAPESQPRALFPDNGVGSKITATNNIFLNVTDIPEGNYVDADPGFLNTGDRPWPFYTPSTLESLMVDSGIDVGLPFSGSAPDIGAYELGDDSPFPIHVDLLDIETLINGNKADLPNLAVPVAAGEVLTWTYQITNLGTTIFRAADLTILDEQGLVPLLDETSDANNDGLLLPGETWIYTASDTAKDLTTMGDGSATYRKVGSVIATRNLEGLIGADTNGHLVATDAGYYRNPFEVGLLFSLSTDTTLQGLTIADEDIVQYDGNQLSKFFDGSDVGLETVEISAFDVISENEILLSFMETITLTGVGTVEATDIVKFTASSLGEVTAGTFSLYLDGSDVGLTRSGENIDALTQLPNGSLLISTKGGIKVAGMSGADEDVFQFIPTSLGADTKGSWVFFFDGSDLGLADTNGEDIDAIGITETGQFLLSTTGSFQVQGLSGEDEDVAVLTMSSMGNNSVGSFDPALFLEGSELDILGDISGLDYLNLSAGPNSNTIPDAQDDIAATTEAAQLLIDVLSNDEDADADLLTVSAINGSSTVPNTTLALASGALVTVNADGTLLYNPNAQFAPLEEGQTASDTFSYTANDGKGGESTATVLVTILGVGNTANRSPLAIMDSVTTDEDRVLNGNVLLDNGSGSDSDPDGDFLTVVAMNGDETAIALPTLLPSGALLILNVDGTFNYDPQGVYEALETGEVAIDRFDYTLSDGRGGFSTATVTVEIVGLDEAIAPIRWEAEASPDIVNYRTENISVASGGQVLSLFKQGSDEVGRASFAFNALAGTYDIKIGAFDEEDGLAQFQLQFWDAETNISTDLGTLTLSSQLGSNVPNTQTLVEILGASAINFTLGDRLLITAFEQGSEHARLDYIELIPV